MSAPVAGSCAERCAALTTQRWMKPNVLAIIVMAISSLATIQ